jgi:hypothetical protein
MSSIVPDESRWSCKQCTFLNESCSQKCKICGAKQPNKAGSKRPYEFPAGSNLGEAKKCKKESKGGGEEGARSHHGDDKKDGRPTVDAFELLIKGQVKNQYMESLSKQRPALEVLKTDLESRYILCIESLFVVVIGRLTWSYSCLLLECFGRI